MASTQVAVAERLAAPLLPLQSSRGVAEITLALLLLDIITAALVYHWRAFHLHRQVGLAYSLRHRRAGVAVTPGESAAPYLIRRGEGEWP